MKMEEQLNLTLQQFINRFHNALNRDIMPELYNEFERTIKELNSVKNEPLQEIPLRVIKHHWWKKIFSIRR